MLELGDELLDMTKRHAALLDDRLGQLGLGHVRDSHLPLNVSGCPSRGMDAIGSYRLGGRLAPLSRRHQRSYTYKGPTGEN